MHEKGQGKHLEFMRFKWRPRVHGEFAGTWWEGDGVGVGGQAEKIAQTKALGLERLGTMEAGYSGDSPFFLADPY